MTMSSNESGASDHDDEEGEVSSIAEHALGMMEIAKECIDRLQQRIRSAGDNATLVASTLLEDQGEGSNMSFLTLFEERGEGSNITFIETSLQYLMNRANAHAEDSWKKLLHFLDNHDTWPREEFWDNFNERVLELGNTSVQYREACFYRTEDGYNIFHLVCKHDPPLKIIQTLIDVVPQNNEGCYPNHYNHLSRSRGIPRSIGTRVYPLWTAIRHGASFDLVKVLVEADKTEEKETLKPYRSLEWREDALMHLLVMNRANYTPEVFSAMLFYLVPNLSEDNLQLIHVGSTDQTPVALLFNSLKDEGRTIEEILQNDDFVFLLRATCYHQHCLRLRWTEQKTSKDFEGRRSDIDLISVPHAFFVCSACFKEKYTTTVLQHLASQDKSFLIDKDMHGVHPIHGVLDRRDYCFHTSCFQDFQAYILKMMLTLAPECARQRNKEGLYPLHRVADRNRYSFYRDSGERRLQLVQTVFEADPDVASIMDNEINLPPFTLPERYEESQVYEREQNAQYPGLSSTYFLLRQRPEMIAETISMIQRGLKEAEAEAEAAEPSAKRLKQGS